MKLPTASVIVTARVRDYLLRLLDADDKSQFLALTGYSAAEFERLIHDIREQLLPLDAELVAETEYGTKYRKRARIARRLHLDDRRSNSALPSSSRYILRNREIRNVQPYRARRRPTERKSPSRRSRHNRCNTTKVGRDRRQAMSWKSSTPSATPLP